MQQEEQVSDVAREHLLAAVREMMERDRRVQAQNAPTVRPPGLPLRARSEREK